MVRNFLALVGLWTIINFVVSILPTSFFEVFQASQAVRGLMEVNQKVQAKTGVQFEVKPKKFPPIIWRETLTEDECKKTRVINQMVGDFSDECQ